MSSEARKINRARIRELRRMIAQCEENMRVQGYEEVIAVNSKYIAKRRKELDRRVKAEDGFAHADELERVTDAELATAKLL